MSGKRQHPLADIDHEILFAVLLNKVADCPFCHCGEEPYVDGEQCPTCEAIAIREAISPDPPGSSKRMEMNKSWPK